MQLMHKNYPHEYIRQNVAQEALECLRTLHRSSRLNEYCTSSECQFVHSTEPRLLHHTERRHSQTQNVADEYYVKHYRTAQPHVGN